MILYKNQWRIEGRGIKKFKSLSFKYMYISAMTSACLVF